MQDIYDIVKNVEGIYESDTRFQILKDFERVLDELKKIIKVDSYITLSSHVSKMHQQSLFLSSFKSKTESYK